MKYEYEARPVLLNAWRGLHFQKCAAIRREWREAFGYLGISKRLRFDEPVDIIVHHECKGRLPDVGSSMECVKAAVDGLVDAKVIPDDTPKWLKSLTFLAPVKAGHDAIILEVKKAPEA
jgi:hypothetical protein